jgi:hypothetical protein
MKFPRLLPCSVCVATLFSMSIPVSGQFQRIGIDGNIPIGKLEAMNDALLIANPAQKLDLMKRLGVDAEIAGGAGSSSPSRDIEIQPIHTHSDKPFGILSLPCGIQNQAFLYLLSEANTSSWHVVDSVPLDCFNTTPTFQVLSLAPGEDSIFVQHANSGHGTGLEEDKATLYTIREGRMHAVLSTPDYTSQGEQAGSATFEQKSFFLNLPDRVIEETRITSQPDSPSRAERRVWRWSAKQGIFNATSFRDLRE